MSMLRSVLTYMGLGPDEDYDDGYLYEADRRTSARPGRLDDPDPVDESGTEDDTIDLRASADPHAQRTRPDWLGGVDGASEESIEAELDGPITAEVEPVAVDVEAILDGDDVNRGPRGRHDADEGDPDVRPLRAVPTEPDVLSAGDGVRVRSVSNDGDEGRATATGPRPAKATILAPRSFGDAKILADEFRASAPVVMNLQEVDRELARRLIDFASGICYALDGGMEKLASQVFLLIPDGVEVSAAERRRLEQLGFGS